ncbi:ABC transporter permease [Naasia lichenicola]|uniref:ABC transporter permease n=1 Tax=Naasia lichenicola TaxID=2565933 RepID=UPI001E613F4B|nr:ABC transporter permease subunit [Naasia lichenicola]
MSDSTLSASTAPGETASVRARPPRGLGLALLASELAILFRRTRTIAMLAALAAVPILIAVAVRVSSSGSSGRGPAFIDQITQNGLFVGVAGLILCIPLFLPLTVGVAAGDTIAGEASHGTLRYLLVAPAGRVRLLIVKFLGTVAFCIAAPLVVVLAGTVIGAILFPLGNVTLLSGDTVSISESLGRALLMSAYVSVSLIGLSAIGLFISTLTDTPVGAMAATIVISVAAQVVGSLDQLAWLHPWLFSYHWLGVVDMLRQPILWSSFGDNAILQLGYVIVFGALAYSRFVTKSILS